VFVVNAAWPGGVEMYVPGPEVPYWRTTGGERYALDTVLAGADEELRGKLLAAHVEAIRRVMVAAAHARHRGAGGVRRLTAGASRLCGEGEVSGQFPQGTWSQ
jgi:hypothetical protein